MKPNSQVGLSDSYLTIRIHSLTVLDLLLPHHLPQWSCSLPSGNVLDAAPSTFLQHHLKSILAFKFPVPYLSASLYPPISTHISWILLKLLTLQHLEGFLVSLVISLLCTHIWRSGVPLCFPLCFFSISLHSPLDFTFHCSLIVFHCVYVPQLKDSWVVFIPRYCE